MKISKILMAAVLSAGIASANDVMKNSMHIMQSGIEKVQFGFINNNADMIREGLVEIKKGNTMFSSEAVIKRYLPERKEHTVNTALLASTRIGLDINIIECNLDEKAYTKAAEGYSDMLNACSSCHSIIRNW